MMQPPIDPSSHSSNQQPLGPVPIDDPLEAYPRITLHCKCGNEFCVNVMRFKDTEQVSCQICGNTFPEELGVQFTQALEGLFKVKHKLDIKSRGFDFSFLYKSTFKQPPAPYPFEASDFE